MRERAYKDLSEYLSTDDEWKEINKLLDLFADEYSKKSLNDALISYVKHHIAKEYRMPEGEYSTRFTHMNPNKHGTKQREGDDAYFDENAQPIEDKWENYYKKHYKNLVEDG